jgi:hypothetical protein
VAIVYFSFTFSPERIRSCLHERVVANGREDHERLEVLAREITAAPSPNTAWALTAMRYGDDWFDPQWFDDPEWQAKLYHMIVLASQARQVIGPDARLLGLLRAVLSQLGWSAEQIRLLAHGDSIDTLGDALHDPLFGEAFYLAGYGGWLAMERIPDFYARLSEAADFFLAPTERFLAGLGETAELSAIDEPALIEMLRNAYLATEGMLATALVRREALYLVLD